MWSSLFLLVIILSILYFFNCIEHRQAKAFILFVSY